MSAFTLGISDPAESMGLNSLRPEINKIKSGLTNKSRDEVQHLAKMRSACADVESAFVDTLIKAMRKSIPESGYLPDSAGSGIYESLADQQLSIYLTGKSGLGLGQAVFEQMVRRENLEDVVREHPGLFGDVRLDKTDPSGLKKVAEKKVIDRPGGKTLSVKQARSQTAPAGKDAEKSVIRFRIDKETGAFEAIGNGH
jgi:flagellar protein FlgJ